MSCVLVSGFPEIAKLSSIVFLIKQKFAKHDIGKFWITDQADIRGTDLKSITISFNSATDAHSSLKILDGFLYHSGKELFPLRAEIERRSPSPYRRRSREFEDRHYERRLSRERLRSRSPLYEESSKLDLEIELLKKKRLIIEEERRLLLESKKLELIKEYGHDAVRDIDSFVDEDRHSRHKEFYRRRDEFDRGVDNFDRRRDDFDRRRDDFDRRRNDFGRRREVDRRRDDFDRREYRRRRSPPPSQRPFPSRRPGPPKRDRLFPQRKERLPKFRTPVVILLKEMKESIEKYKSEEEGQQEIIINWLKVNLRQRLTKILENTTDILSFVQICDLYRKNHPQSSDDDFVEKVVEDAKLYHHKKENLTTEITKSDENLSEVQVEATDAQTVDETEQLESVKGAENEETKQNAMEITDGHEERTQETNNKIEPGNEDSNVNGDEINQENIQAEANENLEVIAATNKSEVVLEVKESAHESKDEVNDTKEVLAEESTEINDNSDWAEGTVDWN